MFKDLKAWVLKIPSGNDKIEIWGDIVYQMSKKFFSRLLFAADMVKAIKADSSFGKWWREDIDTFLRPIQVYVDVAK